MKKVVFLFVCTAILVAALCGCAPKGETVTGSDAPPVSGANGEVVLSLPHLEGKAGSTLEVPVNITADSGACAIDLQVAFDSNALTYQSFASGKAFEDGIAMDNLVEPGLVKLGLATLTPPKQAGALGVLTFELPANASGTIDLTLTCQTLVDYDSNDLKFQCVNGSITVK